MGTVLPGAKFFSIYGPVKLETIYLLPKCNGETGNLDSKRGKLERIKQLPVKKKSEIQQNKFH